VQFAPRTLAIEASGRGAVRTSHRPSRVATHAVIRVGPASAVTTEDALWLAVSGGARTISSNRLEAKLEEEVRCYSAFATGLLPQGEGV
jgi:hypothetical protein